MRLLVTGANGMLGHRVVEVARDRGHDVTGTDLPELDLLDAEATGAYLRELAPDAVVHCAAFTDVDGAESNEELATRVNAEATANVVADAPYVVAVSTDYVFAGDATEPYLEDAEPAPRTAYGRSKLAGERTVDTTRHAICRTAWLYGAGGKNFVDTMLRLAGERDELRVVGDQVGSPTWTGHLAEGLVELAERGGDVGLLHATGGGACSWYELAVEIFDRAGLRCRVLPTTSDRFPRPARRPAYSVLGSERDEAPVLPAWQDGVAAYLSERAVVAR